ncbi:3-methylmercaptopropionyl-CoA dehydrogenase [Georgfuchsia toluolica]|uniref:3-methylmercaptopropionyl-CoA dehydrogenase n=1 Tax=Georgfuchsia toluolica TaxID=424218 RepID=A0A916J1E6_9PROT|nr:acyl-CoA dehydrogenase [Georgfuchsia toluolica]CAG4882815.1 3-methylmercaptopropionyl-CoA dehydrogenase [Georgfuchsia toluolica]
MSEHYMAPLDDLNFVLNEVLDYQRLFSLPAYEHADVKLAGAVLNESARFNEEVLGPLNSIGDEIGSRLENGRVKTPPGFRDAYWKYVEGGWPALDLPLEFGGQALPLTLQAACAEMVNGACVSFGMLPLMERAATRLLLAHAPRDIVAAYAPDLVAGKWGATICISEAQAGSDVGRISTRAQPRGDGRYTLSGSKIFITYGDQDYTEQIVHMVLARLPDAPAGTRGLSLFLVPSRLLGADGRPGAANAVNVSRVEHKMGLKASPTCVLNLEGAEGVLIGRENAGLKAMFTMVNTMRLEVAVQGVAVAGAASVKALRYAAERPQGGPPTARPTLIVEHADVRRMLYIMRARTEAMRALVLETAYQLDIAQAGAVDDRAGALALAEWLLPVCKACGSEAGFEVANLAVQVLGGHGYVADAGVEQYVRDSRVMSIYEGANGIQALDLVTRKLGEGGRYELFTARIRADLTRCRGQAPLAALGRALEDALNRLDACTRAVVAGLSKAPRDVEAGAAAYLALVGVVAGGWMWLRMAAAANGGSAQHRAKRAVAKFYIDYLLPEVRTLECRVMVGAACLDSLDAETLTG